AERQRSAAGSRGRGVEVWRTVYRVAGLLQQMDTHEGFLVRCLRGHPSRLASHLNLGAFVMRTFTPPVDTRFYAGVDLHARAAFVVALAPHGQPVFAKTLPARPDAFLRAVAPFRAGLLVACECMHCWYWLADTCRDENIAFVLGHAWAMRAVHGQKTKC